MRRRPRLGAAGRCGGSNGPRACGLDIGPRAGILEMKGEAALPVPGGYGKPKSVREDGPLDRTRFQAGVAAHAVFGHHEEPLRALGVLAVPRLDAVHGTDVDTRALALADVLDDHVRHDSSYCSGLSSPEACGPARPWPTSASAPARGSRSRPLRQQDARATTRDSGERSDTS